MQKDNLITVWFVDPSTPKRKRGLAALAPRVFLLLPADGDRVEGPRREDEPGLGVVGGLGVHGRRLEAEALHHPGEYDKQLGAGELIAHSLETLDLSTLQL